MAIDRERTQGVVLVFGATGQQGGAVAAALRRDGWAVRAFVRDPQADKARALAAQGVELARGDFADLASIRTAMQGAYGVFSVQPSSGQGAAYNVSDEQEVAYGKAIADLAVAAGVQHLVYTSVNAAGPVQTGMGHFDSKSEIEAHIRGLALASTIVRPAGFMELLMLPGMGLDQDAYTFFLRPGQAGQTIAAQDIGRIVARIFAAPERNAGRTLEIAGDQLTAETLQASLSRAAGRPIHYARFPDSLLAQNPFLGRLAALFDDGRLAGRADIPALEREFGPLLGFDAWLAGPGKPLFEAALAAGAAPIALR
ncbi:NmrA/HSCARG family protein [Burkholderia sp. Ac-20379]|uniref:NmrA/HSCARG family protein n=1 Tax=Burkholderia sp. Ac-20379 TaxID=2703900 RepID=UPI00198180B2|nr:NmrA/HSCARG family protein [Burkholderia sp. Ac-20379]MBN3725951.1 NmrA/HSCARG family protein [Burkholderia sp. Ac-20379]